MATIEVRSRGVNIAEKFGAQHLFMIFINDNGNKFIIRGGRQC